MSRTLPWLLRGAMAALVGLFSLSAYWLLWTTFMVYDDEGYVLWSLHTFAEGGRLYEEVYTQYGPFFFLFHRALHALGLEFTNTGARALALCYWLGTAGICGALVWRQTRATFAAFATFAATFVHLWPLVAEPSHPGGFICFVVALIAFAGSDSATAGWRSATIIGGLGVALALTKINVGAFAFIAAGAAWLLRSGKVKRTELGVWLAAAGLALLPVVLMRAFDAPWTRTFIVVDAAAAVAIVLASRSAPIQPYRAFSLLPMIVAAFVVTSVTTALMVASGTSLRSMFDGVVLGPLRHPSVYALGFNWKPGSTAAALSSLVLAIWLCGQPAESRARVLVAGRLIFASVYLAALAGLLRTQTYGLTLSYGLAFAWVFVVPVRRDDSGAGVRAWLALLVVTQALHAFPVAGSQISWGTFLWVPLAALGVHDALANTNVRQARPLVIGVALAAFGFVAVRHARIGWTRYVESDALALRGAENLRLPETLSSALRILTRNSAAHADVLFSLPGMHSFHRWSGVPPPTAANATHWFSLLSETQQEAIRFKLAGSPRSAVILQRYVHDFIVRQEVPIEGRLADWLRQSYVPAFKLETYEFWVPRGRSIAALGTASFLESTTPDVPRNKIEIVLAIDSAPAELATIELRRLGEHGSAPVTTWTNANARLTSVPLAPSGRVAGAGRSISLPCAVTGIVRLEVFTDEFPRDLSTSHAIIYVRDGHGRKWAEARFVD